MIKSKMKKYSAFIFAALAVITAIILRQIGFRVDGTLDFLCNFFRSVIYVVLFGIWGVSLRRRIIQPQVRGYLTSISALMVFWIVLRTVRYMFAKDPLLLRYLWYLYYLPMLFIPLFSLFVAMSLGKPENSRLPKWTKLLYIPTAALLLPVLTNDFHQLVFVFPKDALVWGDDYSYAFAYYLSIGWLVLCALSALGIMAYKCRIPHSRRFFVLPFIPVIFAVIYGVLYIARVPWLRTVAGDMTIVFCLLFALVLECCIGCGLIPNNTGYDKLFAESSLGAQITDKENNLCLASANAKNLTKEQMICAKTSPVSLDENTLVKSHSIRFGNVLWQVDVAELTEAIEQIEENCKSLAQRNRIRQQNLETRKKLLALQEKNRVTDLLNRETASQINLIDRMLSLYDTEADGEKRNKLLAGVAVLGAYIKRYGNLLLVSERTKTADIRDLARCFDESFVNLELLNVECRHTLPSQLDIKTKDMLNIYRSFEEIVEACLFDLSFVWINIRQGEDFVLLSMEFVCDTDLSPLKSDNSIFSYEDGAYRFTFKIEKGGEHI